MSKLIALMKRFFTIRQVAETLSVSTRTVRRWIDAKSLHAHKLGGQVRIHEDDLAAFVATRRR